MNLLDLYSRDMCHVCGQTPCNCTTIAEGEVRQFPKKHRGDLASVSSCAKCGGDLQGGKYMGRAIKVCIPCKQVYLPPNSGIDQQGNEIAEGTSNIGQRIKALYQKIDDAGPDAADYMYYDSPIFAQYWDEYEGDLDSIIAEVDPSELQVILAELESAVEDQGLAEGDVGKLAGITALGIGAGLAGNYVDQQQPKVEVGGQQAYLIQNPGWGKVPDTAMILKGKDGKTYKVWSPSRNNKTLYATPVEGVKEGYDKWGWHTSLTNGEFMPTKYGNKAYVYLHDMDNQSANGNPQLVTVNKPAVARQIAQQFGGKVVKTDLNTYRIVKPAEQGVAEGLPQTLRKVVPGYAKREIDKKMDAGKFGKTDTDKDANFQRYKKIQDKLKEQGVAEDAVDDFLARGGQIQQGKLHKPRKGERWQGSSHIGAAGGQGTKGRVSGMAANTNTKSGKPVVSAESALDEVSDRTLMSYLAKVDADSQKHSADPSKRSPEKASRSVAGFAQAFNKLDARKQPVNEVDPEGPDSDEDYREYQRLKDVHKKPYSPDWDADDDEFMQKWYRERGLEETNEKEADYGRSYQDMVQRMGDKARKQEQSRPVDISALARRLRDIEKKSAGN